MIPLDTLLRRSGLKPEERLLVVAKTSVWPGDQLRLTECLRRCQGLGMARGLLEEVLLQAILFCGFPRVVNAFRTLQDAWPTTIGPRSGSLPPERRREAGDRLFGAVYGENADRVKELLIGYHAELHDFVIDTAYERILSRPGLEPRIRELLAVGVLALTEQIPQLIAHGRGAIRFGATEEEVREAIYTATGRDSKALLSGFELS